MGNFYVNITTKKASPQEVVRYIKSIAEIGMLNHDDDVLAYELWSNGQKVDEYDSCPGYFSGDESRMEPEGGDAKVMSNLLSNDNNEKEIEKC